MQRKLGGELDSEKNKLGSTPKYLNCSQWDGGWSMLSQWGSTWVI